MFDSATESTTLEADLAALLNDLSEVQHELLSLISEKRALLTAANVAGLAALQAREVALIERLGQCQQRRSMMLAQTNAEGQSHASLAAMAAAMPARQRQHWTPQIREASSRSRLLQHQSLTNWVLVQRTLIHLSQMLEIIATGGRLRPTYGKGDTVDASGNLVDQEA